MGVPQRSKGPIGTIGGEWGGEGGNNGMGIGGEGGGVRKGASKVLKIKIGNLSKVKGKRRYPLEPNVS